MIRRAETAPSLSPCLYREVLAVVCRAPEGTLEAIACRQSRSVWCIAYGAKLWGLWDRASRAVLVLSDTAKKGGLEALTAL